MCHNKLKFENWKKMFTEKKKRSSYGYYKNNLEVAFQNQKRVFWPTYIFVKMSVMYVYEKIRPILRVWKSSTKIEKLPSIVKWIVRQRAHKKATKRTRLHFIVIFLLTLQNLKNTEKKFWVLRTLYFYFKCTRCTSFVSSQTLNFVKS